MGYIAGLVFFTFFYSVHGMFLDDNPCDLSPRYDGGIPENSEFVTGVNVPPQCVNGTFRWDYPRGHVTLHFPTNNGEARKVCFGGGLIANAFTLVDVTDGKSYTLPDIERFKCLILYPLQCNEGNISEI